MSQKQKSYECNTICWGIAAFVGIVSMVMLALLGGFSALQAIFTGGLIGVLLGLILILFVCREQKAAADLSADEKPAQRYAREAAEKKEQRVAASGLAAGTAAAAAASGSASGSSGSASADTSAGSGTSAAAGASNASTSAADSAPAAAAGASGSASGSDGGTGDAAPSSFMSSGVKPSAPLAGEAELASRKGEWKYDGEGDNAPSDTPSGLMSAPAEAAPAAAEPAAAAAAPAAATPAAASEAVEESKPELYDSAPSEVDDLKLISGVGPKLEQTLNEMGIYKFAQVSVWGAREIAWVDQRLRFKGRIERDDWMSQAKILAEGGETEFSARKKK